MADALRDTIARNRAGAAAALPSVCTAHPDALAAALLLAESLDRPIIIEATSNQVNHRGGYTDQTPQDFAASLHALADTLGVDRARITLGGDHLGPQAWRDQPAGAAMAEAEEMIAAYLAAGFTKIHLDCSEGCRGEPAQLDDETVAGRAARLATLCDDPDIALVIGTEVPPPGGARRDDRGDIPPTTPEAARATLDAHQSAFEDAGIPDRFSQVVGLVVQPGVEFAPMEVQHLPQDRDPGLKAALSGHPAMALEAHSTDYQHPSALPRLAELGFAILKVGPALTFAYRQALFALDHCLAARGRATGLAAAMETLMVKDPRHWQVHYADDPLQRAYGYADRIRYYWPHPDAQVAVAALRQRADATALPDPLLAQHFAAATLGRADALDGPLSRRLIHAQIMEALAPYFFPPQGAAP